MHKFRQNKAWGGFVWFFFLSIVHTRLSPKWGFIRNWIYIWDQYDGHTFDVISSEHKLVPSLSKCFRYDFFSYFVSIKVSGANRNGWLTFCMRVCASLFQNITNNNWQWLSENDAIILTLIVSMKYNDTKIMLTVIIKKISNGGNCIRLSWF